MTTTKKIFLSDELGQEEILFTCGHPRTSLAPGHPRPSARYWLFAMLLCCYIALISLRCVLPSYCYVISLCYAVMLLYVVLLC